MDFLELQLKLAAKRKDDLIIKLQEDRKALKAALQDVVDGGGWYDLRDQTGLSEERCKEIMDLAWSEEKENKT